jgi:3-phytase
MERIIYAIACCFILLACQHRQPLESSNQSLRNKEAREDSLEYALAVEGQRKIQHVLTADKETHPVLAAEHDDAADDPAFWFNKKSPENSLIFGTNKKDGVYAYDVHGKERAYYPLGMVNNIDIRHDIIYKGDTFDILGGSNRSDNSIIVYKIEKSGSINPLISNHVIDTIQINEVYGFCLYKNKEGELYYIVNGKNGTIHAYHLINGGGYLKPELWNSWKLDSQPEGMVADDELGWLYIGEEEKGIWKVDLTDGRSMPMILNSSQSSTNPSIRYDIEGLSIYYGEDGNGFLLASSQGNFSYALFDRVSNEYMFSFKIEKGDIIDGVEETDGLEVFSDPIGEIYPEGIIIFQDGFNYDGEQLKSQNFKILDIRKVLDLINQRV